MFGFEFDGIALTKQKDLLEAALATNPKTREVVQKLVRKALLQARREVAASIKFANGDPRNTRQSIRTSVYRKVLGGNMNILDPKKSKGGKNSYVAPRKLRPGQRGGNRRKRSPRTQQILNYPPFDREFILRFVNSGTRQRFVGFRNAQKSNRTRYMSVKDRYDAGEGRTGNRGSIIGRDFFSTYGEAALERAAERLSEMIETEITKLLNEEN